MNPQPHLRIADETLEYLKGLEDVSVAEKCKWSIILLIARAVCAVLEQIADAIRKV